MTSASDSIGSHACKIASPWRSRSRGWAFGTRMAPDKGYGSPFTTWRYPLTVNES